METNESTNKVSKVSEISTTDLQNYIRITELSAEDSSFLSKCLEIAKKFIIGYTGVKDLDTHEDFIIVIYVLCQDMYDNRTLYVDKSNLNKVVETILNMHSINFL